MHPSITETWNLPFTIAYAIRKQYQLDSFAELPEEKRPPRNIWHNEWRINKWFDEVFNKDSKQTVDYLEFNPNEVD